MVQIRDNYTDQRDDSRLNNGAILHALYGNYVIKIK
jgi:hypothetical protein